MVGQSLVTSSNRVTWTFRIQEQGFVTRYGYVGGDYYKQFLPGGIEAPSQHPPKRIDRRLYEIAKRRHEAALGSSGSG